MKCKKCGCESFRQKITGCSYFSYIDEDGDVGGGLSGGNEYEGKWRCFGKNHLYHNQEEMDKFFKSK